MIIRAYGESFIEQGIPAEAMDDGWTIEFTQFKVSVNAVRIAGTDFDVHNTVELTDSSEGQGHEVGVVVVAAGAHRDSSFSIGEVEVHGLATRNDTAKSFAWKFDEHVHYHHCETTTTVSAGGESVLQLTIHADHLFSDSVVAEEPVLGFSALAEADANEDGDVSRAELAAADIGGYDPGSEGGIDDLWSWLTVQVRTLGHVDGEGHCETTVERR